MSNANRNNKIPMMSLNNLKKKHLSDKKMSYQLKQKLPDVQFTDHQLHTYFKILRFVTY